MLASYEPGPGYDELVGGGRSPQGMTGGLWRYLEAIGIDGLVERQQAADREIRSIGSPSRPTRATAVLDRPWPFDVIPRVLAASEWDRVERGPRPAACGRSTCSSTTCTTTSDAVRAGVVPGGPGHAARRTSGPSAWASTPPGGIWAQICGSDLVRGEDGTFYVLEDNLRVPSGVSYLLENRMVAKRVFPELFRSYSIEPVGLLRRPALRAPVVALARCPATPRSWCSPRASTTRPTSSTPSWPSSSGIELVEGGDLLVLEDDTVYMRTVGGLERVDVIYRRIDELYPRSRGVPARLPDRRAGTACVPGGPAGWRWPTPPVPAIADDKAVYSFVPEIIRYFLAEEPILPNVPTWRCGDPDGLSASCSGTSTALVVKPANESGGYGVVIGPTAGAEALAFVARRIEQYPPNWVAQPVVSLVHHAHAVRRDDRPAPRRPAAVCPARSGGVLRDPGRLDPGGPGRGVAHRELVAGWGQQGHLDRERRRWSTRIPRPKDHRGLSRRPASVDATPPTAMVACGGTDG